MAASDGLLSRAVSLARSALHRPRRLMSRAHAAPIRFILVGIANTLVGLFVIFSLKAALGLGDVFSNVLGYLIGLINSFVLNRAFTFKFKGATSKALTRFGAVALVGYALNLLVVMGSITLLKVNSYVGQALGVLPYTLFTYFGFKYYAFRQDAASQAIRQ